MTPSNASALGSGWRPRSPGSPARSRFDVGEHRAREVTARVCGRPGRWVSEAPPHVDHADVATAEERHEVRDGDEVRKDARSSRRALAWRGVQERVRLR